jgi:hypothetical protein
MDLLQNMVEVIGELLVFITIVNHILMFILAAAMLF